MDSIACIVIAGGKRTHLLDEVVLPAVSQQPFLEVLVCGEHHPGTGFRYLHVPAITNSTVDALIKRDVGTLATTSDWLFFVSDDHAVRGTGLIPTDWRTIIVPRRFRDSHELNMGLDATDPNRPYIGGHAGLFSRKLIQQRPWTTMPHHRLWDLLSSREYQTLGARLEPSDRWVVEDVEPGATPWL